MMAYWKIILFMALGLLIGNLTAEAIIGHEGGRGVHSCSVAVHPG